MKVNPGLYSGITASENSATPLNLPAMYTSFQRSRKNPAIVPGRCLRSGRMRSKVRSLLIFMIGLCAAATAGAKCMSHGLWVYPQGKEIKQNSIFILEAYSLSQHIIPELNQKHKIYLKSGDKIINLSVSDVCVGQFNLTQAVLRPDTELEAGLEYTMCIDKLPEHEELARYNQTTHQYEPVTYTVIPGKDEEKPRILQAPREMNKTFTYYGCGPEVFVEFSNPARDDSELFVFTIVKNLKTGAETIFYLIPKENTVSVGHGMCAGAFDFEYNEQYEVTFAYMDASGNFIPGKGPSIRFTPPDPDDF